MHSAGSRNLMLLLEHPTTPPNKGSLSFLRYIFETGVLLTSSPLGILLSTPKRTQIVPLLSLAMSGAEIFPFPVIQCIHARLGTSNFPLSFWTSTCTPALLFGDYCLLYLYIYLSSHSISWDAQLRYKYQLQLVSALISCPIFLSSLAMPR